jgi:hypothetical protein
VYVFAFRVSNHQILIPSREIIDISAILEILP